MLHGQTAALLHKEGQVHYWCSEGLRKGASPSQHCQSISSPTTLLLSRHQRCKHGIVIVIRLATEIQLLIWNPRCALLINQVQGVVLISEWGGQVGWVWPGLVVTHAGGGGGWEAGQPASQPGPQCGGHSVTGLLLLLLLPGPQLLSLLVTPAPKVPQCWNMNHTSPLLINTYQTKHSDLQFFNTRVPRIDNLYDCTVSYDTSCSFNLMERKLENIVLLCL